MVSKKKINSYEYRMGRDYALNGANTTNCNFKIFASEKGKSDWELGCREAKLNK
jgi:hypothetical protein